MRKPLGTYRHCRPPCRPWKVRGCETRPLPGADWSASCAPFELRVSAKNPSALRSEVEALLARHKIKSELRETTEKHIAYLAHVPHGKKTDRISEAISALNGAQPVEVTWDEKRVK